MFLLGRIKKAAPNNFKVLVEKCPTLCSKTSVSLQPTLYVMNYHDNLFEVGYQWRGSALSATESHFYNVLRLSSSRLTEGITPTTSSVRELDYLLSAYKDDIIGLMKPFFFSTGSLFYPVTPLLGSDKVKIVEVFEAVD